MSHRIVNWRRDWLRLALFALCPALLFAGAAAAVDVDAAALFQQLDLNADGQVARGEAPAEHALLFDRLLRTGDADGDGRLTGDELAAAFTVVRAEKPLVEKQGSRLPGADALVVLLAKLDANGDRRITADEAPPRYRFVFDQAVQLADGDKNGLLDNRELAQRAPRLSMLALGWAAQLRLDVPAELAALPPERVRALNEEPNGRLVELLGDPARAPELFDQFDANGNGFWEAKELPGPLAERFQRLMRQSDRNGDGRVSRQEFLARSARMARFRGPMPAGANPRAAN